MIASTGRNDVTWLHIYVQLGLHGILAISTTAAVTTKTKGQQAHYQAKATKKTSSTMGFLEDALLVGGGVTFAQHEHNKHAMQRMTLNNQLNGQGQQSGGYGQQRGLGYSMSPSYSQNQGYGQGYQGYGGQEMITVPKSEWDRLQNEAAEGRRQMQRYVDKMEELDRERRQMKS